MKYFPNCYRYDEGELNRILSVVLQTREYQQIISKIKAEIQSLQSEYNSISKEQTKTATELAYAEIISYNKKNLEKKLQNENR